MTIFAREVLEGTVIIGQYRTVVQRSPEWQEPEKQKAGLKAIWQAAGTLRRGSFYHYVANSLHDVRNAY